MGDCGGKTPGWTGRAKGSVCCPLTEVGSSSSDVRRRFKELSGKFIGTSCVSRLFIASGRSCLRTGSGLTNAASTSIERLSTFNGGVGLSTGANGGGDSLRSCKRLWACSGDGSGVTGGFNNCKSLSICESSRRAIEGLAPTLAATALLLSMTAS